MKNKPETFRNFFDRWEKTAKSRGVKISRKNKMKMRVAFVDYFCNKHGRTLDTVLYSYYQDLILTELEHCEPFYKKASRG